MKTNCLLAMTLLVGLPACGQTGPLYLPKNAPKVYDEPSSQAEEAKKRKTTKPEPPPLPEKSAPAPGQPVPAPDKTEPTPDK